jgi:alpha-galactosidase
MSTDAPQTLSWGHDALTVVLDVGPDSPVRLRSVTAGAPDVFPAVGPTGPGQPLAELVVAGSGRASASSRCSDTVVGRRLRYAGSETGRDGGWHLLRVDLRDEVSGLAVEVLLRSMDGVPALQSRVRVTNEGPAPAVLLAVASLAAGFGRLDPEGVDVLWADSEWLG